ncbi:MAG TPA: hypothetical protein VHA52_06320, partial [Candidatus Babeliaceae bacterium]|nr:hypothetical protein [Candidatus Babeliaceae bacterium]
MGKLFVIWGPSGAGKTSLVIEVLKELKDLYNLTKVVTYTTRSKRPSEVDGVDYYFITRDEFLKKKLSGFFLESSDSYGSLYGSPASILEDLDKGYSFIMIVDLEGAVRLRIAMPNAVFIKIEVTNPSTLKDRLCNRGSEKKQDIERRLLVNSAELSREKELSF